MEQIAAKVASLVPPAHQHRGELVVEKPSEEKGRQLGEARRRPLERSAVEVKGAGGILVLGGFLVTAAIAAGVTIVSRRAQAKRPPASKKEKVEGLNGSDKLRESTIDGSAGIQEDDCVSAKPKSSSFEAVACDGVEELRNGRELGWEQLDEKNWGKTDLGLQNGIRKEEIDKQASFGGAEHGMINKEDALGLGNEEKEDDKESESGVNQQQFEELLNAPKICLVREEEDKEPSPAEAEDSVKNHYETELKQSFPALGNGEKEVKPSLKQPHVYDKESNDGQSDTNKLNQSTDVEISKRGCQSVRDRDEQVLAFLEESKESQFEMVECKSNVSRQLGPLTFKEIVEQHKVEASPSELVEEARPQMDVIEQQTAQVIDEHEQQKEHEILTVESEYKVNEHQTEQISESEFALINEGKELKIKEPRFHMTESEPFALKEEAKALSVGQQTEHVLNEHDLAKIEEHIEGKKENEVSPEGNEEKKEAEESPEGEGEEDEKEPKSSPEAEGEEIEEKKEAEVSPEKMEHEEIEDKKETETSPEREEKAEDEEAIEVKEEPESSVEGEDDGTCSNQTRPHIIQSEVSAEEFSTMKETEKTDEKGQPASFAEEEEGTNNNQTQANTADPQLSTEDYSTVKEVEKMDDEKEEPVSSVEGEDDGTCSNQTRPHIIQPEVGTEEFSTTTETEKTDEKAQPASFAEEEEGTNNNQTQTNTADPQLSTEDYSTVKEVEKMDDEKEESVSSVEGEDDGTYSNQTRPHIIQSEVSAEEFSTTKETEKTDEKAQPASFAEEEEGTNNNQTQTNTADPQLSTEDYSTVKEAEKMDDEKEEPVSSVEGEDDGTCSNQTRPHIIQPEVGTEEFSTTKETEEADEKGQPASFAEEEEGSNHNQTQTNTADPQFSTEDYSTAKEVEKMDNEKEEPESFPEQEAQMRDKGSDGAPVSSAESNEAAISPAKEAEQGKILLREVESKVLSDYLISPGEVKVKVLVKQAEEKQQGRIDNVVRVHANKAEEKEEESMIGREKITEDKMQQQVMATIREKALMLEKFLMDIPDRLLVGLLAMALTMLLLHYVKPFSQLYQMVSEGI